MRHILFISLVLVGMVGFAIDGNSWIHQITDNSVTDDQPSLYDGTIAWRSQDRIKYWDGTNVHSVSGQNFGDYPSLYDGSIAWQQSDGNDREIWYWDGTTAFQITNNDTSDRRPSLFNGTIAWQGVPPGGNDGSPRRIFYWNGVDTIPITDDSFNDWNPSIYNGTIAWQ